MKVAYVFDQLITCGGVIVPFEHCKQLIKRGYDAFIVANGTNEELAKRYPTVPVHNLEYLSNLSDDDALVCCWWPQSEQLKQYKGRKLQFVQGHDLKAYVGDDWKERCLEARKDLDYNLFAVSRYAGGWTGRDFDIVPNGIGACFFHDYDLEKDIDILIEGNYEPNKQIDKMIDVAVDSTQGTVVWFGRETKQVEDDIEVVTNPSQETIVKLYQRSKVFLKLSDSEGFCLPILEAMASGCAVMTKDMGGNDFCVHNDNCYLTNNPDKWVPWTQELIRKRLERQRISRAGYETAKNFTWAKNISKLETILNKAF